MKTQHTPAPWVFIPIEYGFAIKEKSVLDRGFSDRIAEVNEYPEEREANARLIASAPELLEALDDLVEYLGKEWKDDEFVRKAKKAIKKATK